MNRSDYQELLETSWRRELHSEEAARLREFLAHHPADRAACEEELRLHELLRVLPDQPVPSNFTALVVAELRRNPLPAEGWRGWGLRLALLPARWKAATAALLLALGGLAYHQHQGTVRAEIARNLAVFSQVAPLPPLELLEDFEAIQHLHFLPPEVDLELMVALQDF